MYLCIYVLYVSVYSMYLCTLCIYVSMYLRIILYLRIYVSFCIYVSMYLSVPGARGSGGPALDGPRGARESPPPPATAARNIQ